METLITIAIALAAFVIANFAFLRKVYKDTKDIVDATSAAKEPESQGGEKITASEWSTIISEGEEAYFTWKKFLKRVFGFDWKKKRKLKDALKKA